MLPHELHESLIGLVEQSAKFLKPVYKDDTLYPELEISNLISKKTTGIIEMKATILNQKQELVFRGIHKYLIKRSI